MRDGILPEDFAKLLIRFTHEKKAPRQSQGALSVSQ